MCGITAKNHQKNKEKIFSKCAKPHGKSVLPFYIIDILITAWAAKTGPLSILSIQKEIQSRKRIFYDANAIQASINNLHLYSDTIEVITTQIRAGRSRAKGFTIQFINTSNNGHTGQP